MLLPELSLEERKELPLDKGREGRASVDDCNADPLLLDPAPPSEELPELGRIRKKLRVVELAGLGSEESSSLWFLEELKRNEDPSRWMPDLLKDPDLPGLQDIFTEPSLGKKRFTQYSLFQESQ